MFDRLFTNLVSQVQFGINGVSLTIHDIDTGLYLRGISLYRNFVPSPWDELCPEASG